MNVTSRYFEAQFPGKCICGEEFRAGRRIAYSSSGVITEDCSAFVEEIRPQSSADRFERALYSDDDSSALLDADRLPTPPPNGVLCDTCFLYHGPGQVECW